MSMLQDISTFLTALGTVGSESANPPSIIQGFLPEGPDQLLALFALPGRKPERTMGGRSVEQPQLNIIARAETYTDAETLINRVFNALDGYSGEINGTRYLFIEALHQPWDIGEDESDRNQFSVAFHIKMEPMS